MKDWNYENEQWMNLPSHLKHLPLFTRHFDLMSWFFRCLWGIFLKALAFKFWIRLKTIGDWESIYKTHPKLLVISNHSSHLDAVCIAAAIPFRFWLSLYISAAKDYWFSNDLFSFFSKHCLGAIPIDRKERTGEAAKLCINLLNRLDRIWLILFPEGTRSTDGYIRPFKRGVSVFSLKTDTPILFLYLEGNAKLMPKGRFLPVPGALTVHIGPVHPPAKVDILNTAYKEWVTSINPKAFKDSTTTPAEHH